jgi:hypothetical protein
MGDTVTEEQSGREWYRTFRRKFTTLDILVLIIGAVLGLAGNAIFDRQTPLVFGLVALALLAIAATLAVDRLGRHAAEDLDRANKGFKDDLYRHYNEMEDRLKDHLSNVHASVQFIADGRWAQGGISTRPSYDVAEAAARRASKRIWVVGDYSPPPDHGAEYSDPPKNRSSYLEAIEEMLKNRHKSNEDFPILEYRRYIQRPVGLYRQIRSREAGKPGITLTKSDMIGDLQAFDHCARVLQIAYEARMDSPRRIQVDLRLIPFLPNCPSVLIVDDDDVQFTIPTRTDGPGDDFAALGLLGILAMKDKARGSGITWPFVDLLERLKDDSVPITKVEGAEVPGVEVAPVDS